MIDDMATAETRTHILDAAERLFAERGYRGTSVRAITDNAGVNLAAVGYHFGSKSELLAAVARRATDPITAAQSAALDRLLDRHEDPSVTELVEAFALPLLTAMGADAHSDTSGSAGSKGGADSDASAVAAANVRTSRLIAMILTDPASEVRGWTGPAEDTVRERFYSAFARALPDLSPEELWFRMRGIAAVVTIDRVDFHNRDPRAAAHSATASGNRWAIGFLAAALSAPPSP